MARGKRMVTDEVFEEKVEDVVVEKPKKPRTKKNKKYKVLMAFVDTKKFASYHRGQIITLTEEEANKLKGIVEVYKEGK